jgi:hypothetical protein
LTTRPSSPETPALVADSSAAERKARRQLEANAKRIGKTKRGTVSSKTLERRRRRKSAGW